MRHPLLLSFVAALSLSAVACGGEGAGSDEAADPTLGTARSAVQGGIVDTAATNNFAVGITSPEGAVCSGTLIAPNLVLTARHCVVAEGSARAVTCRDHFGPTIAASELRVTTSPNILRAARFYDARDIVVPANDGFCGNDIALVVLAQNVPASEAVPAIPVVQFAMIDEARLGSQVAALGYGITRPDADDAGERRVRENIDILCVPGSSTHPCEGDVAKLVQSDAEFVTDGFVCSGDSGGGAFAQTTFHNGVPHVLGALSRGPQSNDTCLAAIYSRTDKHASMIIDAGIRAAELGGYAPAAWAAPLASGEPEGMPAVGETSCEGDTCTSIDATEPSERVASPQASGCSAAPSSSRTSTGICAVFGLALAGLAFRRRRG